MNDLSLESIREQYAALSDEQLLRFAEQEGSSITDEAFNILRHELVTRKIGTHLIIRVKQDVHKHKMSEFLRLKKEKESRFIINAISMAYNQKEKGISNSAVATALEATGIYPEAAVHIVNNLKSWAQELSDELTDKIQLAAVKAAGCALLLYMLKNVVQLQIPVGIYLATNLVIILLCLSKRNDLKRVIQAEDKESGLSEN